MFEKSHVGSKVHIVQAVLSLPIVTFRGVWLHLMKQPFAQFSVYKRT